MTITEFLLERIAEDEAAARAAICPCGGPACVPELGWYREGELNERLNDDYRHNGVPARATSHILNWSPARVLAECKAKRAIVERYKAELIVGLRSHGPMVYTIRQIATVWSDHPDYDPEWRP